MDNLPGVVSKESHKTKGSTPYFMMEDWNNLRSDKFNEQISIAPLSFSQLQMWIIDRMQPGNHAYNLPVAYRIKGSLNIEILENSFNEIIKRHDSLRTTFALVKEQPVQQIHPEYSIKIETIDLVGFTSEELEIQINKLAYEKAVQPFDLSVLPLIRVILMKLGQDEYVLLLNLHHIISDGWSLGIIFRELSVLYNNKLKGVLPDLPEILFQYSDYVKWQLEKDWKPSYDDQLSFWKKQLDGVLPYPELPLDKTRPAIQSLNGSNEFFFLPNVLIQKVQSIGFKKGCTFYMTILAAFQAFLYKYSIGEDILIGTPVSNRPRKTDEVLIGNFVNIIAIRANLKDDPDFLTLLSRIQNITIDALTNRDLPFEKIVENLKIRRDPGRNPVFQIMLQVLPRHSFELSGLQISNVNFDLGYSQIDLSFHLYQLVDGYQCRIEYSTDLFESDTIKRMAANFQSFLNELILNSDRRVSEIPFLNQEEKNKVLFDWNNTLAELPQENTLVKLFENTVLENKNNIALQFENITLTYDELNSRANLLADYLLKAGVKPGTIVGICIERSINMLVAMLGILKTGSAYLPLDPSFPRERLEFIMEDAGISFLLTQGHLNNIFPGFAGRIITIDKEWENIKNESESNPDIFISPTDLAYVIYTSGSSGKPKGVLIEHRAVINFLSSMQTNPGLSEKDVLLAVTTISFDISVLELFLPLVTGARVVIASKTETVDGDALLKLINKTNTTIMQATPSTWKLMIEAGWTKTPQLKMLCGGEALQKDLAYKMLERGKELWNMYGPTETTVWSSVKKIEINDESIVIGSPIANTQFYIVDKNMQPVPIGVSGELLIGGLGIARGYLNRPQLNEEKFINNPFTQMGSRLYRTGDLVRYLPNGDIEFLGRTDFQVKLRGYRIELGEIENILSQYNDIKEVVVAARQNRNQDKILAAYIVPAGDKDLNSTDIRNFLKAKLPEYMIPSVFVRMESFPLTPNGKIDRKALPEPDIGKLNRETAHIAPRNDLEKKITKIWENVIGVSNIGINDNFFDLGGHSLLAVRMFTELEKLTNIKLPLVTLFEHQTIEELVAIINSGNWKDKWSSLIKVKNGSKTPLFLIHGAEGNILVYKDLANYLEKDQSFYALQARGLDGSEKISTSIEEMASYYIKEIKKVQPNGPYNFGGYCLGGTIAYEMAQQLFRSGDKVKNIFLIETYNVCSAENPSNKMTFTDKLENIKFHYKNIKGLNTSDKIKFLNNKSEVLKRRVISNLKAVMNVFGIKIKDTVENYKATHKIREINDKAQTDYRPKGYKGKTILLKPIVNFSSGPDPNFGWNGLIDGEFKIYNLDIAPRGMLYEPFVKETAAIITKELAEN